MVPPRLIFDQSPRRPDSWHEIPDGTHHRNRLHTDTVANSIIPTLPIDDSAEYE